MKETFTLSDVRKAMAGAIRQSTGKEPIHPNGPVHTIYVNSYLKGKIKDAKKMAQKLSGSFWEQPHRQGPNPMYYNRGHIAAILDELKDATKGEHPKDLNLSKVPVNPEIIDLTERILFCEDINSNPDN